MCRPRSISWPAQTGTVVPLVQSLGHWRWHQSGEDGEPEKGQGSGFATFLHGAGLVKAPLQMVKENGSPTGFTGRSRLSVLGRTSPGCP